MHDAGVAQAADTLDLAYLAWKSPRKRERSPTAQQVAHLGFFGNGNAADRSAQRAAPPHCGWRRGQPGCVRWAR
jgi:hypothetical protein